MTHITIIVAGGTVTDVYSDSEDVKVDLIDLDTMDDDAYDAAHKAWVETKQNMKMVW